MLTEEGCPMVSARPGATDYFLKKSEPSWFVTKEKGSPGAKAGPSGRGAHTKEAFSTG